MVVAGRLHSRVRRGPVRRSASREECLVIRAYRFALDPTPRQARALERHAGAARFAFNWGLAAVKTNLDQREAERSYGIDGKEPTPLLGWSFPMLLKAWNQAKHDVAPWWPECSKEAYSTGLNQLARALKNWSDSRTGKRAGRPVGFPGFKARRRTVPSCKFTTGAYPSRAGPQACDAAAPRRDQGARVDA